MVRAGIVVAAVLIAGCGEEIAQDVSSWRQWHGRYGNAPLHAQTRLLFVVDDATHGEAPALRAWLRVALARSGEVWAASARNVVTERDPAAWHPVDWRAIPLSPSGELDVGAATVAYQTDRVDAAGIGAFADAVVDALPVGGTGAYRPLEVAFDAAKLLIGDASTSPVEAAFQAQLGGRVAQVVVASTREDAGRAPVESLVPALLDTPAPPWVHWSVLPPGAGYCGASTQPPPGRFGDWLEATGFEPDGWSCAGRDDEPLFPELPWDERSRQIDCPSRPVERDASGMPRCQVTVEVEADEPCDAEHGWADPLGPDGLRAPHVEIREGPPAQEVRVCEVVPLQDAARTACEETEACEGCGSGWCGTRVSEVLARCHEGGVPSGLRFVGAAAGGVLVLNVVCDLEP